MMYPDEAPPYDVEMLKLPPHSLEAEQSVLGGLLMRGQHYEDISDILSGGDFFQPRHRQIFTAIAKVHSLGDGIDIVTVAEALPDVEQIGGIGYLMELANGTPSTGNIRAYAKLVNTRAQERQLIEVAQRIAESGFDTEITLDAKLASAQQEVMAIGETSVEAQLYGDDALSGWLDELQHDHEHGMDHGIPTGLDALDKRMRGMREGHLILLGGRPGMGKSTLAFQIAANVALQDEPTMVFSLEMPKREAYDKIVAGIGHLSIERVSDRKMQGDDWTKLSTAIRKIKGKPLYIDDRGGLHINQIMATARRMHRKNPLSLIVVDYIQYVRGEGDNRTAEVGSVSRSLKALAKELNCTVLALTQLSRKCEERGNKRPMASDLRDSGELEQDADIIMFTYRDEVYNENTDQKGVAEVIFGKFRNGQMGTAYLASQLHLSRFDNLAYEYQPPAEPDRKSYASGIDL